MNEVIDNNFSSTSSFLNFTDYTNSSANGFNNSIFFFSKVDIIEKVPSAETMKAIAEAREPKKLIVQEVDDFFDELES